MGILIITWNFPPRQGGMENLIAGLADGLRKNHCLFVVTSFASVADGNEAVFRPRCSGLLPFFFYSLYRGSVLLARHPEIRVILGGSTLVLPVVVLLAKIFRRRSVVNVHGLDLVYPSLLYHVFWLRWLRHCDRVVANSSHTASLAERINLRKDAVQIIPPGIYWDSFALPVGREEKKAMGLDGRKVLLFVGRLARRKGVGEFLQRSFARIVREVPEAYFLIVGENPSHSLAHHEDIASEIRRVVRGMTLESHVRMLGRLTDLELAKVYQISDLMVLPALATKGDVEGFGIVILEAAAAGRPTVATRVGGIPDAIEDGRSGILVDPEESDRMSEAVVRLLRDDQARLALGQYAQNRVREQFGWDSIIRRYEELFKSMTESK